jgi:hypothetical protein
MVYSYNDTVRGKLKHCDRNMQKCYDVHKQPNFECRNVQVYSMKIPVVVLYSELKSCVSRGYQRKS